MCRKPSGVLIGYACDEHALRCIICAGTSRLVRPVKVCDECASRTTTATAHDPDRPSRRCIVCELGIRSLDEPQPAMYCEYCVLLERDRDGCPKMVGTSQQVKDSTLRMAASVRIN